MNHKEKLLELYNKACLLKSDNIEIDETLKKYIETIALNSITQKGVYTVLVTLAIHKLLFPKQDIRLHQEKMKNGFSGRTIDTKYITPTLKKLNLPSMAESGWLTRSLEQPFPYTLDYQGHIQNPIVKEAFLQIINYIQNRPNLTENIVICLLFNVILETKKHEIKITKLENPDSIQIKDIIQMLSEHFFYNYHIFGGAKLPVIAFYAVYMSLLQDIKRYEGCHLKELGYHTTCDTTSKSAGDIEVFDNNNTLKEALEIKFEKEIDANMVRIAKEKIIKYNPIRYYILSTEKIKKDDINEIEKIIADVKNNHGCQIILNGVIPSLKYYLRLVSSLEVFIKNYSHLIEIDKELKPIHKECWNNIIHKYNGELFI